MKIQLQDVHPEGIPENRPEDTVWNDEIEIDTARNYLIRGASGRGKSTFLHLLLGIRRNYKGTILFDAENIRTFSSNCWATLRQNTLAMVFQDLRLLDGLTARENLLLKIRLSESSQTTQIEKLAQRVGIQEQLDKPCRLLSYGQQQRLALLRALLQPFQTLLLDEPFSHLDPANIENCLGLIRETCQERGAGILLATLEDDYGLDFELELRV